MKTLAIPAARALKSCFSFRIRASEDAAVARKMDMLQKMINISTSLVFKLENDSKIPKIIHIREHNKANIQLRTLTMENKESFLSMKENSLGTYFFPRKKAVNTNTIHIVASKKLISQK